MTVSSGDEDIFTLSPATLTFTSTTWSDVQTITVTATDDSIVENTVTGSIVFGGVTGPGDYEGLDITSHNFTMDVIDNDSGDLTLSTTALSVTEGATVTALTAVLTAQPASNVSFTLTNNHGGEMGVTPPSMTFTSGNWDTAQTLSLIHI